MIFIIFIITALLTGGCGKLEGVFIEKDLLQRPEAKRCADCHAEIFREWEKSRHAKAWVSENFKKESENYGKTKCLKCHAPLEVVEGKKPEVREKHREDGINCASCHYREETNAIHGPLKVWSPPHPSKQDPSFEKASYCASCHEDTYKEWKLADVEKSCQECHMPSKGKRDLINKFPYYLLHFAKPRHDHSFPALKAKEEDIKIETFKEGKRRIIRITNVGVPHNLPTADQGDPKYYIMVEIRYTDGKAKKLRRVLSPEAENTLIYKKPYLITFFEPKDPETIKIEIYRRLSWKKQRELIKSYYLASR